MATGDPLRTEEIVDALTASVFQKNTIVNLYGPQAALLILLYRLDVVGVRKVTWSYAQMMMNPANPPFTSPPCSIPLAVISLHREFIQFCPKYMADKDLKI